MLEGGCGGHTPIVPGTEPRSRGAQFVVTAPGGTNGNILLGVAANLTNKANDDPGSFGEQENGVEQLEALMNHRYFALHVEYRSWKDLTASNLANDASIKGDLKYGRVPVISLHCGDDMTLNGGPYDIVGIANGNADKDLALVKAGLATLRYPDGTPYPVMLRWFWEFNVNARWPMPSPAPNNNDCYEQPGANNRPPDLPTQFINAWTHIHNYFDPVGGGGDPDVTFVWNPAVDDASPWSQPPSPAPFYPGNSQVDWIGVDGYNTQYSSSPYTPLGFGAIFHDFVGTYSSSSYGKPIMIGENASCQEYADPDDQASYLENLDAWLDNQMEDENNYYADVHAYAYFDTTASSYKIQPNLTPCTWWIDTSPQPPQSISGQQELINISADSNFAPMVAEP